MHWQGRSRWEQETEAERIRTYNFPQGELQTTDWVTHNIEGFLDGEIDELVNELITSDQAERLKNTQI